MVFKCLFPYSILKKSEGFLNPQGVLAPGALGPLYGGEGEAPVVGDGADSEEEHGEGGRRVHQEHAGEARRLKQHRVERGVEAGAQDGEGQGEGAAEGPCGAGEHLAGDQVHHGVHHGVGHEHQDGDGEREGAEGGAEGEQGEAPVGEGGHGGAAQHCGAPQY